MKAIPSTDKCGHCNGNLKKYKTYYDARFRYYNSPRYIWGWICWRCWAWHGIGLGTGFGQEYDSKTDEKLRG